MKIPAKIWSEMKIHAEIWSGMKIHAKISTGRKIYAKISVRIKIHAKFYAEFLIIPDSHTLFSSREPLGNLLEREIMANYFRYGTMGYETLNYFIFK